MLYPFLNLSSYFAFNFSNLYVWCHEHMLCNLLEQPQTVGGKVLDRSLKIPTSISLVIIGYVKPKM